MASPSPKLGAAVPSNAAATNLYDGCPAPAHSARTRRAHAPARVTLTQHVHPLLCWRRRAFGAASLARGVPGAPPEGPNVTAKPVRPLLSRQFTAAVAAGPGGGGTSRPVAPVTPTKAMAATHTTTRPPSCTAAASDSARCPPGNRARAVQVVAAVRRSALGRGAKFKFKLPPFRVFLWIFFYFRRINGNFVQGRRDDSPPGAATDGRGIWGIGRGCWPTEVGARAGGCVVRGERTRAGYAPLCPGATASLRVLWCWLTGVCLVRRTSVDHCWRLSGCVG